MVCKYKEEIITFNDREVKLSCDQMPAEKAIILKFKLVKMFGATLGELATMTTKGNSSVEDLLSVFEKLFSKNEPEDVLKLIKEAVIGSRVDGNIIDESAINTQFSGDNLFLLYRLFAFIIKSNYSNFMSAAMKGKAV